ncbi:hypothetical protein Fmac_020372 [Flemingia macrophylla]|uniref:Uncharacterized protein n=1 Tax=Flemingia macrophylla TaxID=520843 RepID=A0ABD1LVP1_9FABA
MLKIWKPCFTCMSGDFNLKMILEKINANGIAPDLGCDKGTSLVMTIMHSFGNDHGHFGVWCWTQTDIFDVDHFIDVLCDEVSIVKELPNDYSWSTREYYGTGIRATRIKIAPVQATSDCYIENVLPVL